MDFKLLLKNYGYPALAAGLAAGVGAYQDGICAMGDWMCLLKIVGYALAAFLLTKFNPVGGKDATWFVPNSKHGELPSLKDFGK